MKYERFLFSEHVDLERGYCIILAWLASKADFLLKKVRKSTTWNMILPMKGAIRTSKPKRGVLNGLRRLICCPLTVKMKKRVSEEVKASFIIRPKRVANVWIFVKEKARQTYLPFVVGTGTSIGKRLFFSRGKGRFSCRRCNKTKEEILRNVSLVFYCGACDHSFIPSAYCRPVGHCSWSCRDKKINKSGVVRNVVWDCRDLAFFYRRLSFSSIPFILFFLGMACGKVVLE